MTNEFKQHNKNQGNRKLTFALVYEMREKYNSGRYTQAALSREYRVSVIQVGRIVRGEVWQEADGMIQGVRESPMPSAEMLAELSRQVQQKKSPVNEELQIRVDQFLKPSLLDGGDVKEETSGFVDKMMKEVNGGKS